MIEIRRKISIETVERIVKKKKKTKKYGNKFEFY